MLLVPIQVKASLVDVAVQMLSPSLSTPRALKVPAVVWGQLPRALVYAQCHGK